MILDDHMILDRLVVIADAYDILAGLSVMAHRSNDIKGRDAIGRIMAHLRREYLYLEQLQ